LSRNTKCNYAGTLQFAGDLAQTVTVADPAVDRSSCFDSAEPISDQLLPSAQHRRPNSTTLAELRSKPRCSATYDSRQLGRNNTALCSMVDPSFGENEASDVAYVTTGYRETSRSTIKDEASFSISRSTLRSRT